MFALYENEDMTRRAGAANGEKWIQAVTINLTAPQAQDFVFYFGSPDPALTLKPASGDLTITPRTSLPDWIPYFEYSTGQVVQRNGLIFKCLSGGLSGGGLDGQVGERVSDNDITWHVIGAAYQPESVALALSREALDGAIGGAPLTLGSQIYGGAAVAIYVRVSGGVNDLYSAPNIGQIGLFLNDANTVREDE